MRRRLFLGTGLVALSTIADAAIYSKAFADGLRPDPILLVSEWADTNRMLSSKSAAEPGPWRTDRTPYLREIMDALSPSSSTEIIDFMKGAQIGGTECGNNWIGYVIDQAPGPMMAVQPTVDTAKRNSKQRIDPLIEESPCLRDKVKERRARDSGNTVLAKEFPGGILVMTGANSAVGLRSMAARFLFLDEVDAYDSDVDGEGDPITLAMARQRTFPRRKTFRVSTPKLKGQSRIESGFEAGSQERYQVPCPHCGVFQHLRFAQVVWPAGEPAKAQYKCEACEVAIPEHHKTWMLERGEWVADNPNDGKHRSFHLSSLYSPVGWFSWGDAAAMFERSQKDPALLKVFVNTVLGETWEERGEAPDDELLYGRKEPYKIGAVQLGGLFLTAGVDVQADRLEIQIVAWGRNKESWLVDYVVLPGRTAEPKVWTDLTALLNTTYKHVSGVEMSIMRMAIDSGYATQEVYAWARTQGPGRVLAIKGQDHGSAAIGQPSAVDVNYGGKKIKRGAKVWPVATPMLKSELYGWLQTRPADGETYPPYPFGYCHFPELDREFFKQLTAEQYVTRVVKGFRRGEWIKTRERNEALDTRVYARAAAAQYGLDRLGESQWLALENNLTVAARIASMPAEQKNALPQFTQQRQIIRSSFMG